MYGYPVQFYFDKEGVAGYSLTPWGSHPTGVTGKTFTEVFDLLEDMLLLRRLQEAQEEVSKSYYETTL
jgi:hypothetical protein